MSVTGSKRARRDSSSSLGSSLSMEMPPLFQNGVVGQTTSHLVSRETDLSLGSLLSRYGCPGCPSRIQVFDRSVVTNSALSLVDKYSVYRQ